MKRTKQDKQFQIQFDLSNRNFLMNNSMYIMTFSFSITALIFSVISIIYSMHGSNYYFLGTALFFSLILVPIWYTNIKTIKKQLRVSKKINTQLDKKLLDIYPEYKTQYH